MKTKTNARKNKKINFIDNVKRLYAVLTYFEGERRPPMLNFIVPYAEARRMADELNAETEISGYIAKIRPVNWQVT